MLANEKMPKTDFNFIITDWHNSLQPCEISESELLKIHNYLFTKKSIDSHTGDGVNPIEVTDIVDEKEIRTETKSGSWIDYELCFKPKQAEEIEAVELKYTTQEMIDAVNYGFQYAHESQNHTGDVPLGNILQWIMYKRNLLDVPKEFKDLKNNSK